MNLCLYSAKALACFVHGKMNNLYQQIARCLVIFFFASHHQSVWKVTPQSTYKKKNTISNRHHNWRIFQLKCFQIPKKTN